jgi:hypothetical protein
MKIDYEKLLPMALKAMYPNEAKRNEVERTLGAYGTKPFHREPFRVKVGVLYLTSQEPMNFMSFVNLACSDYRDLLCAAEYPYSSKRWGLREKDPVKFKSLEDKEKKEYLAWIRTIKQALQSTPADPRPSTRY